MSDLMIRIRIAIEDFIAYKISAMQKWLVMNAIKCFSWITSPRKMMQEKKRMAMYTNACGSNTSNDVPKVVVKGAIEEIETILATKRKSFEERVMEADKIRQKENTE